MGEIVIEEVNYKAFFVALANTILLVAAFAWMIYGFQVASMGFWLPGVFVSFMLLVAFAGSLMKVLQIKKLLTITHEGIVDYSTIGGIGFISFDDVKDFTIVTIYNKKAIAVIPKNINCFLAKYNPAKRRIINKNMNLSLPPVTIFVDRAKDMEPEDILTLLHKRLADYSRLYS